MHALSWMIPSWPTVNVGANEPHSEWPTFWHSSSHIVVAGTRTVATQGHSVWMAESVGQVLAVAWDWAEVRTGVPALSDPNAILSNVRFVDVNGDELAYAGQIRCLSELVYRLSWQIPVRAALRVHDQGELLAATERQPRALAPRLEWRANPLLNSPYPGASTTSRL